MPNATIKSLTRNLVLPVGRALSALGISANSVTLMGLVFAAGAGLLLAGDHPVGAFACMLGSGLCDLLDGAVARARGSGGSVFGAAFDSTADRYGEALILGGAFVRQLQAGEVTIWFAWLWVGALVASFLTSYVRARAEGLGLRCEVGLLERPERLAFMALFSILPIRFTPWIFGILAVGGHITFIQRLAHVWRITRDQGHS